MGISVYPPASGGITTRTLKQEVFNASGTWTYPTSSKFDGTVFVTAVGGGGAGGGTRVAGGSGPQLWGGGGGGGRVIIDREINVLGGGNQTVTVGNGGVSNPTNGFGEANGGYTVFGSPVIGNYYPDPNMRKGLINLNSSVDYADFQGSTTVSNYPTYLPSYATANSNSGGPKSGSDSTEWALLNNTNNHSLYFDVPPSTAMRLHFRYSPNGSSGTVTPRVFWYDSSNVIISSTVCATYTVAASGSSFTLYSDTSSLTSPANARYAMIRFTTAAGGITDLCLSPASAGLTAPVSGNSSGWTWAGSPDNSWTVKSTGTNLANFVIAQGGGAGWGATRIQNGQAIMRCTGSAGWSAGGHACTDDGTSTPTNPALWFLAGHGGGSDDSAVNFSLTGDYTQVTSAILAQAESGGSFSYYRFPNRTNSGSATREYFRPFHGGGAGSQSVRYNAYNIATHMIDFGRPGKSTNGYGAGGVGAWYSPISSGDTSFPNISAATARNVWSEGTTDRTGVEANTGNGGAGVYGTGTANGQNGSSGLVIVRWYE